mgnify:CR=1 FL=1
MTGHLAQKDIEYLFPLSLEMTQKHDKVLASLMTSIID